MRIAAILGLLLFGGLAAIFLKWTVDGYKAQNVGEMQTHPPFGALLCFIFLFTATLFCFIYAIGMWDSFIAWLQQGTPQPVVVKQF